MITLHLTWHLCLMIVLEIIGLWKVLQCSDEDGGFYLSLGSSRAWAWIAYIFVSVIAWLIYGGIIWW